MPKIASNIEVAGDAQRLVIFGGFVKFFITGIKLELIFGNINPGISSSSVQTTGGLIVTIVFNLKVYRGIRFKVNLEFAADKQHTIFTEFDGKTWQLVENKK